MDTVRRSSDLIAEHTRAHVRNELRSERWQSPLRGVIVTHNGPLSEDELEGAHLLNAPPGAALAGLSALRHDGFEGFRAEQTQLVIPKSSRKPRAIDGVQLHWSRFVGEDDIHPGRTPRRTRPERSVIDAASWTEHDRRARAIVIAAVQQGLTNSSRLRDAVARRGRCHRRALIIESILDAWGGVQSLPERDFAEICLELGWRVSRQVAVRGKDGRYFLDVRIDSVGLAVEIHGIPHMAVERWNQDLFRANEVVIAGERLLIFSSYAVRHEREVIKDQLRRMAASARAA